MKDAFFAGTTAILLCILIPIAAARYDASKGTAAPLSERETVWTDTSEPCDMKDEEPPLTDTGFDEAFRIPVLIGDTVCDMDLHSYLVGAVLAEMPSVFPEEALKAQTVACRTYALVNYETGRHENAAVCGDSSCCVGWTDPEACDREAVSVVEAAVYETDGMVVYYNGKLIDAVFFSCSGGRTEDAAAVWGSDFPYLRSVSSPGEEDAVHYLDTATIPVTEFCETLKQADPLTDFSSPYTEWVGEISYTNGGGVAAAVLGGRSFSGTELRKLFHLNATSFTITAGPDVVCFETKGYGHRVGLSQYGARAMALEGSGYEQILEYYYSGVSVGPYERP